MWSFVFSKENKLYIWLAIDRDTREIIGCYIGDKTRSSARKLWASLPPVYRQCAIAYTDFGQAYCHVIPKKRHKAVGKETGQTNHIERLNNTFRQRISRLVRKSLSFSKILEIILALSGTSYMIIIPVLQSFEPFHYFRITT
jgi:IS1 family transposase